MALMKGICGQMVLSLKLLHNMMKIREFLASFIYQLIPFAKNKLPSIFELHVSYSKFMAKCKSGVRKLRVAEERSGTVFRN